MLKVFIVNDHATAQVFTVLMSWAIWTWWQNDGLISKRTQVHEGLQLSWIAPQCALTIQPTPLSQCGATYGCKHSCCTGRGRLCNTLPTPQQLCSARVHLCLRTDSSCIRADHSTCTHGWSERQTKRPHTAGSWPGSAQSLRARVETGVCWHHLCVRTLVAERQLEH